MIKFVKYVFPFSYLMCMNVNILKNYIYMFILSSIICLQDSIIFR